MNTRNACQLMNLLIGIACLGLLLASCSLPVPTAAPLTSAPGSGPGDTALPAPSMAPLPTVNATFTDGSKVAYLESGDLKVGVDKDWGGAIREIWWQGRNLVNNYDGGRLIGASFYDASVTGFENGDPNWGWNPTPSDKYNHTNKPLKLSFTDGELYVKTRYLEWNPDHKGGSSKKAVSTDIVVETWIKILAVDPGLLHVSYRVTNSGNEAHAIARQELPFAYVRTPFNRFVRYVGDSPWTDAAVDIEAPPVFPEIGNTAASEGWAGFVDPDDVGLILWAPQAYPNYSYVFHKNGGPAENPTYYMIPMAFLAIGPGFSAEFNTYVFAGRWQDARKLIYALRPGLAYADVMSSFGIVDAPHAKAAVSGVLEVNGWAIDDRSVAKVEVLLDGKLVGAASYGGSRPDVAHDYPGVPGAPGFGFTYQLDTRPYANGNHTLEVRATDTAGNSAVLSPGELPIQINN